MINKLNISFLLYIISTACVIASPLGHEAPECRAVNMDNQETFNIADYRNKVVYLDFWASWCPPCKRSFPVLNRLHNELKSQGFEVVAINLDEDKDEALAFLQNLPVDFSIFHDAEAECPNAYEVAAMPSSYIINKKGIVRKVHLGFHDDSEAEIRNFVSTLLNE